MIKKSWLQRGIKITTGCVAYMREQDVMELFYGNSRFLPKCAYTRSIQPVYGIFNVSKLHMIASKLMIRLYLLWQPFQLHFSTRIFLYEITRVMLSRAIYQCFERQDFSSAKGVQILRVLSQPPITLEIPRYITFYSMQTKALLIYAPHSRLRL